MVAYGNKGYMILVKNRRYYKGKKIFIIDRDIFGKTFFKVGFLICHFKYCPIFR